MIRISLFYFLIFSYSFVFSGESSFQDRMDFHLKKIDRVRDSKGYVSPNLKKESLDLFYSLEKSESRIFFRQLVYRFHELTVNKADVDFLFEMGNKLFSEGDNLSSLTDLELYDYMWFAGILERYELLDESIKILNKLESFLKSEPYPSKRNIVQQLRLQLPIKYAHIEIERGHFRSADEILTRLYSESSDKIKFNSIEREKENAYALQELALTKILQENYNAAESILLSSDFNEKEKFLHPNYRRYYLYLAELSFKREGPNDRENAKKYLDLYEKDVGNQYAKNRKYFETLKMKL